VTTYASVDQFRSYFPQAEAGDAVDAAIFDALTRATGFANEVLGFSFFGQGESWPAASVKKVFSEESQWLKLPAYQEGSITSLTLNGSSSAVSDWEEAWEHGRYYLFRENRWSGQRYAVTAQWGYGPPPPAVVEIVLEVAVNIWKGRDRGMFQEIAAPGASGGASGGGVAAIRFIGGMDKRQITVLDLERRRHRDMAF
jgi:hypothetical protein